MSLIPSTTGAVEGGWTFLTNHTHVLLCLFRDPERRLRDVADEVGITERATQRIVAELERYGAITRCRVGRRNRYQIDLTLPLRHELEAHRTVGDLLNAVSSSREPMVV